jgi:hypothetical protein
MGWAGAVVAAVSIEPNAGAASWLAGGAPNAASPSALEASGVPAEAPENIAMEGRETDIKRISLLGFDRPPRP